MGWELFVAYLIITIVLMVAMYFLFPMPDPEVPDIAGLDEFTIPTNSQGRAIPILYGTSQVTGNIMWYGDLHTTEIEVCT